MWQIWTSSPIDSLKISSLQGTLYFYESHKPHLEILRTTFAKSGSFLVKEKDQVPKAIFFDMDATLVVEESIVELARAAHVTEKVAEITEKAMNGQLDFDDALRERVGLLKGLDQSVLVKVQNALTVFPGVSELVKEASKLHIPCHVVTGGFEEIAAPLLLPLGFKSVRANRFEIKDGLLTGRLSGPIFNSHGKRNRLLEVTSEMGLSPQEAAAIGDGANDIPMLNSSGFPLGFNPKDLVVPHAQGVNRTGSHLFWIQTLLFDSRQNS
jgi:phosphoserine phosphatase